VATIRELFEFTEEARSPLERWLEEAVAAARGEWVNLEPVVDEAAVDELAVRRGVAGWMSGRGSDLPYVTIVVPTSDRKPVPGSLGIQHGGGPRAARALLDAGVVPPTSWTLRQDHPRRGLVFELASPWDTSATLDYAFTAVHHLCPVGLDGRWSAVTHRIA